MAPSQRFISKSPSDTNRVLMKRGLAIVLKKDTIIPKKKTSRNRKDSSSVSLDHDRELDDPPDIGPDIFAGLTKENSECYWNPSLVQSVRSLDYKGFVRPSTLLVGGTEYSLEVIRSAWGRRMLRPPAGYHIVMIGDLDPVTMSIVSQTLFAPLPEALCKVVFDLTSEGAIASLPVIARRLKGTFPEIVVPREDVLYRALGTLIRERKLYHTGHGYSVVTPDTFRLLAISPPLERQMLLTNDEAIVRLHGAAYAMEDGRTTCTQTRDALTSWSSAERILEPKKQVPASRLKRCHSLKLLRSKDKLCRSNSFNKSLTAGPDLKIEPENVDPVKKEKPSMFSKLFRRGRSKTTPKGTSFSTQFPPRDWTDPDFVHYNSRATQTLERQTEQRTKARSSSLNRMTSKERHSLHLSSTPVTPRATHRNAHRQPSDSYHYRSSSLPRKTTSPSPKRLDRLHQSPTEEPSSKSNTCFNPPPPSVPADVPAQVKPRPRYQSPFSPVASRSYRGNSLLMANEKYGDSSLPNGNTSSFRPASSFRASSLKPPTPVNKVNGSDTSAWRRPVSLTTPLNIGIGEPLKKPPVVVIPQTPPPEVDKFQPSKPEVITKTSVDRNKDVENGLKLTPNGKGLHLGTTVDVEISMGRPSPQNKKNLLTTDVSCPLRNDTVKIATTWNHSIKNNTVPNTTNEVNKGGPKLTTTTSITTSLTHNGLHKDLQKAKDSSTDLKSPAGLDCGRDSPSKDSMSNSSMSPRSTMTDAKSAFFSESPNTTTEVHLSKDDSGFSSSASTSRPMSVSPC